MKQVKKEKKKDNYLKFSFLFPVVLAAVDAVLMAATIYVYTNQTTIANMEMARLIAQAGTISIALSPTFLMITAFISFRHMKKHPHGSAFYIKTPMFISLLVWGLQVIYSLGLMSV